MCLVLWTVVLCSSVICILYHHTTFKLVPDIVQCSPPLLEVIWWLASDAVSTVSLQYTHSSSSSSCSRRYIPGWKFASSTSFHWSLSFFFSIHCLIFLTFRCAKTSSNHLKWRLRFLLPVNSLPSNILRGIPPFPFSLHDPTILSFGLL